MGINTGGCHTYGNNMEGVTVRIITVESVTHRLITVEIVNNRNLNPCKVKLGQTLLDRSS